MDNYQPGACNIGKNEIRKRYALAVVGFVIAALIAYAILSFGWSRLALIATFVFLVLGFEGFYQGHFKFCAGFAARGIYDFKGSGNSKGKVLNSKFHNEDMRKAKQIHLYSLISGLIVATAIYLVL